MPLRQTVAVVLLSVVTVSASLAASKNQPRIVPMAEFSRQNLLPVTRLIAADTCLVSATDTITHLIQEWVIGNELYKNYLDPAASCASAYPYTVTEVNMPMYFESGATMTVSVDIELVDDTTVPGCHVPGVMVALSSDWEITIPPEGGFFDIWIPLDSPQVVHGPFFAGFFLGSEIDPALGAGVVIDTTTVLDCTSFNIWDPEIGFIDLLNNDIWNFPGVLVLYVNGYTGGTGSDDPYPQVAFVNPIDGSRPYASTELWAMDLSGSGILDYVSFEYSDGGAFVEIGRDFDGTQVLRNGLSPSESGNGFSMPWSFTDLTEGSYTLRATLYDTLGRYSSDEITVHLEPTPPIPKIVEPDEWADFCSPIELVVTCADENISYIQIDQKAALNDYSSGLVTLFQNLIGDANGNPQDGNRASAGEFGDYYNAPVAAAIAARLWFDRGYTDVMKDGLVFLSTELLAENLAAAMDTRENFGTYDEDVLSALTSYFTDHGDDLKTAYTRYPSYVDLRKWVEGEERAVIIGLGGESGFWLAVDGFKDWPRDDGSPTVAVSVPMTGTLMDLPIRTVEGMTELQFTDSWYQLEIMVSLQAGNWEVDRNLVGVDYFGDAGWSLTWIPDGLEEDQRYYFRGWTQDGTGYEGSSSSIFRYNCSQVYMPGDFNSDNLADMADLSLLIDFIAQGGPAPDGGAGRADTNCDNLINPADIVYFMNYLYGNNVEPCH